MGKKQVAVSLRKPPPADPDAFVAGAEKTEAPAQAAPPVTHAAPVAPRVAEGPSVTTRVGERREVTVYLPPELARKLSVHCLELDRDVSNVVADALAEALAAPGSQAAEARPADAWARARMLLVDLRARFPRAMQLPFVPFVSKASA
jgi:hypothetical protein